MWESLRIHICGLLTLYRHWVFLCCKIWPPPHVPSVRTFATAPPHHFNSLSCTTPTVELDAEKPIITIFRMMEPFVAFVCVSVYQLFSFRAVLVGISVPWCSFESSSSCLWGFLVVKLQTLGCPCLRLASIVDIRGYRDRCLQRLRSTCEMPPPDDTF